MANQAKQKNKVEAFLEERIDPYGEALMGKLWRVVYETLQDAIALCLLFSIPGWISKVILKADYSGFDQCYQDWNGLNVNRYACCVIVGSGFLLWIIVTGRIIGRTMNSIFSRKKK